jgi:hypothetical protein
MPDYFKQCLSVPGSFQIRRMYTHTPHASSLKPSPFAPFVVKRISGYLSSLLTAKVYHGLHIIHGKDLENF